MKKRIVNVSRLQAAKVAAVLYLVLSIPLVLIAILPMLFSGHSGMPLWLMLLLPLFYAVFGFVFTFIGAWAYNFVASKTGGIEYTTIEVE